MRNIMCQAYENVCPGQGVAIAHMLILPGLLYMAQHLSKLWMGMFLVLYDGVNAELQLKLQRFGMLEFPLD